MKKPQLVTEFDPTEPLIYPRPQNQNSINDDLEVPYPTPPRTYDYMEYI